MIASKASRTTTTTKPAIRKPAVQPTIFSMGQVSESGSRTLRDTYQLLERSIGDAQTDNERNRIAAQVRLLRGYGTALWGFKNATANLLPKLDQLNSKYEVLLRAHDEIESQLPAARAAVRAAIAATSDGIDKGSQEKRTVMQLENSLTDLESGWRSDGGMTWAIAPQLLKALPAEFDYANEQPMNYLKSKSVVLENRLTEILTAVKKTFAEVTAAGY